MGGSVIGQGVLWGLLATLGGCASGTPIDRGSQRQLRSTVTRIYQSVVRGDEAEYRRLVQPAADDAYSDALARTMFESIRLHQAVDAALGGSVAAPATSRAMQPTSSLAAVDYRQNARSMADAAQGWTFTVTGDRATIDQLAGRPGAPALRRVGDRWVLVPPPWDAPVDTATYRLMIASERRLADALTAARAAVRDGTARSVEDVNAILRRLLAEPTSQPQ